MHTTTVRFDGDTWADLSIHARRLGVSRATLIRDAARSELIRREAHEAGARAAFGASLDDLHTRVARIEAMLTRRGA